MAKSRFIYKNGEVVAEFRNDELVSATPDYYGGDVHSLFIAPDLPDVVSPIDGSIIRGRAGLREHCRRHDVVPTEDLKGLPPKPMFQPLKHSAQERRQIREYMSHLYDKHAKR